MAAVWEWCSEDVTGINFTIYTLLVFYNKFYFAVENISKF